VEQPPPAVLFQSRRGRLLYIVKRLFTVKACGDIFSPSKSTGCKSLTDTTGRTSMV
jgi:hypothetical protein